MATIVSINELVIKDVISFSCYGINIINNVVDGTLIGFTDGSNLRDPSSAAINHSNIYASLPTIPTHTPNNYTKYSYLVIRLANATIVEIGIPWINTTTLSRLIRQSVTLVINDFNGNTQALIDNLNELGYLNFTITVN